MSSLYIYVNISDLQKSETNGYMVVECHPIISIPVPHAEVKYSEVKPPVSCYTYAEIFMHKSMACTTRSEERKQTREKP